MNMPGRMSLGEVAQDVRSLFTDETREWVAKNGTEIKQVGNLVFVMMPHHVPPTLPVLQEGKQASTIARNMASALDILGDMQPHLIDDIAQKMGLSTTTARRTLAPLLKTGAVHRRVEEGSLPLRWAYFRP